jgi:hypothetical protein
VPELALHYHPGAGADVLGLGWSLRLPAIERSLRTGVPRYDGGDTWTLKNLGDGEELVLVAPGIFRQRIEQGPPVVVTEMPDGSMVARTTDGTGTYFGLTADARLARGRGRFPPGAVRDRRSARQPHRLYLHAPGRQRRAAAHPHHLERRRRLVHFSTTSRAPTPSITRAPGFRVVLGHRLAAIRTEAAGAPVRTTQLRYATNARGPEQPARRDRHRRRRRGGAPGPALRVHAPGDALERFDLADAPALDPTAEGRAWVDVDGDALPDLLEGQPGAWRHRKNLGGRALAPWKTSKTRPPPRSGPPRASPT